jgi:hypothetical protein
MPTRSLKVAAITGRRPCAPRRWRRGNIAALTACFGLLGAARADTIDWTGPNNGSWYNIANWIVEGTGTHHAPTASDTVKINASTVLINGGTMSANLIDLTGATLDFQNSPTIDVASIIGVSGNNSLDFEGGGSPTYVLGSGTTVSGAWYTIGYYQSTNGAFTLNNQGTIDLNTNAFTSYVGAGNLTLDNSGTFEAANGNLVQFNANTTNEAGASFLGDASSTIFLVGNNTFINNGNFTVSNLTLNGTATFTGSSLFNVTNLTLGSNRLVLDGGTLAVSTVKDSGTLDFVHGGTLSGATVFKGSNDDLNFEGGGSPTYTLGSGVNLSGSIYTIGYYQSITGGAFTLNNQGTINLNTNAFTSYVGAGNLTLDNSGTFEAANGNLVLFNANATNEATGNFLGDASSTINFYTNTFINNGNFTVSNLTLNGTSTFTGSGVFNVTNLTMAGQRLILDGGTLAVSTVKDSGTLDFVHGGTLSGATVFKGSNDDLNFEGGGSPTYTLGSGVNLSGSIYTIGYYQSITGGAFTLNNQGTINLNTNAFTSYVGAGNLTLNNTGTFEAANSNVVNFVGGFANAGTLNVGSGSTINFNSGFTQTAGATVADGTLNLNNGANTLTVQGGMLSGGGTVKGSVISAGTVSPGSNLGTLNITGAYTQQSGGALTIDLGGYGKGSSYSLLNVTGAAGLSGTLNIALVNNFEPLVGDMFEIVDYGSHTGTFSNVTGAGNGFDFNVVYNAANIMLDVTASPVVTWINNGDGDWSAAANWSSHPVLPGANNNVFNNTDFTITHSTGNDTIDRFTSTGAFKLTGGSLTVGQSVQVNNTFTLDGGALKTATVLAGSGGQGLTVTSNTANLIDGVTLDATADLSNGGFLRANNAALNGNVTLGSGASLIAQGTSTIGATTLTFNSAGAASDLRVNGGGSLSLAAGAALTGEIGNLGGVYDAAGNNSLSNAGMITLNVAGNTTTLAPTTFINSGTVAVSNGAGLLLSNTTATNSGTFTVANGPLTLTNSTLNNTGSFSMTGGTLALNGGMLTGGAIRVSTTLAFNNNTGNELQGVALNANINLTNGGFARIKDGSLNSAAISLDQSGLLVLQGAQSLTGATVTIGNGGGQLYLEGGSTLTLDAASQLTGKLGIVGDTYSVSGNRTLVNNGLILDAVNGDTLNLQPTTLNNAGTLEAKSGATLTLTGVTATNSGTIEAISGSALNLTNSTLSNSATVNVADMLTTLSNSALTNTGTTTLGGGLALTNSTLTSSNSLTLSGGAVSLTGSSLTAAGTFSLSGAVTLANSTLSGNGGALGASSIAMQGSTLANLALAQAPAFTGANTLNNVALTVANLDLSGGQTLRLINGSAIVNNIALNNGAALVIQGAPTIAATNITFGSNGSASNLYLNAPTQAAALDIASGVLLSGRIGSIGAKFDSNGDAYARTLTNEGTILSSVAGNTTTIAAGSFTNNGSVQAANGANLILGDGTTNAASGNVSLTGGGALTLTGTVTNAGSITLDDVLSLNNATFTNNGNALSVPTLTVANSTLRNGALTATNTPTFTGSNALDGVTLTAPKLDLTSGGTLSLLNGPIVNAAEIDLNTGTILRLASAPTLNVTNMVFGSGGGSLALESNVAYTIGGSTTLTGDIVNLGGPAQTAGTGSSLTNQGAITLNTANTTTLGSAAFSNVGTVDIGGMSTLSANTDYDQTAGTTIIDGALQLNGHNLNLNGGTLNGTGTITGSVVNAANVSPGHSSGVLNITGSYTQTAAGTLAMAVNGYNAGIDYSQLKVSGAASLAGTLNVSFAAGFHPYAGDSFDLMTYGSETGAFGSLTGNTGFVYALTYNANDLLLTVTQTPYGIYWAKSGNGDWSDTTSWQKDGSTGTLPGPTDDVINNTLYTITHSVGNDAIQSFLSKGQFDLTGGALDVVGPHNTVQVNNIFTIDGGTLKDADVLEGNGGQGITFTQNKNNVLNNVTLNFALDLTNGGYVRSDATNLNGHPINLDNDAVVGFDAPQTLSNVSINWGAHGVNTLTAEGTGTLTLGAGLILSGATVNIGSNLLTAGNASIDNIGTLTANGNIVNVMPALFSNHGTAQAIGGGILNLDAAGYGKIGTVRADGSRVNLQGGQMTLAAGDSFQGVNGGTIHIQNTLDLTNQALDDAAQAGLVLDGGTLRNGTITNGGQLQFANNPGNTLDNITLNGGLNLTSGAPLRVINGLTQTAGTISLDNHARLYFDGTQTISNLNVAFGNTNNYGSDPTHPATWNLISAEGGGTLKLGNGIDLTGAYAAITSDLLGGTSSEVENTATFTAGSGQNIIVFPTNLVNDSGATMQAINGGVLSLNATAFTNNGTAQATGGSTLNVAPGTLNNLGTLYATGLSSLYVSPTTWGSVGLIQSDGANTNVYLGGGTITLAGNNAGQNLLSSNGGQFYLTTTIDNTGKYFSAVDVGGIFNLQGGGFEGGLLNTTTVLLRFTSGYDNVLDNVTATKLLTPAQQTQANLDPTLLSGLNLNNGGWAHIEGTFVSNGQFLLDNGAQLTFDGDRNFGSDPATINGNVLQGTPGTFVIGAGTIDMAAGTTLVLGSNTTVTARNLTLNADTLINHIELDSDTGSSWRIKANTLTNDTLIPAGQMMPNFYADIAATHGGTMVLNVGTLNNGPSGNGLELIESRDGGQMFLNVANWQQIGHIQSVNAGSDTYFEGGALTLGANDSIRAYGGGDNVIVQTTLNNPGFINLDDASAQISGTLEFRGGTLKGGALNTTSANLIFDSDYVGQTYYGPNTLDGVKLVGADGVTLAGLNLNNGGSVRIIDAPPTPYSNYQFQLDNGADLRFQGDQTFGSSTNNAATFTFGNIGGTLAADNGTNLTLNQGTTMTGGLITIQQGSGNLSVNSGVSITGSTVNLDGATGVFNLAGGATVTANQINVSLSGGALNLNQGLTFGGGNISISGGTLNSYIPLTAASGQSDLIAPAVLNNYGGLAAANGGQMSVTPTSWNTIGSIRSDGAGSVVTLGGGQIVNDATSNPNGTLDTQLQASGGGKFILTTGINNQGSGGAGAFFNPVAIGGNLVFSGVTLIGGRLNSNTPNLTNILLAGTPQVVFQNAVLSGVTLTDATGLTDAAHLSGLDVTNGGNVTITNSLTSSNHFLLDNDGAINFATNPTNTWTFNAGATFDFGVNGGTLNPSGTTLILNAGVVMTGVNATLGTNDSNNEIDNHTVIASRLGGNWTVAPVTLDNTGGVLEALQYQDPVSGKKYGSTLTLAPDNITNLGTIQAGEASGQATDPVSQVFLGTPHSNLVINAAPGSGTLPFTAYADGQIVLGATLNLNGDTLNTTTLGGGYFVLQGGTLQNGNLILPAISHSNPVFGSGAAGHITFASGSTDILQNMALHDPTWDPATDGPTANLTGLDLSSGANVRILGTLASNDTFLLAGNGSISFDGDRHFSDVLFATQGSGGTVSVDGALTLDGTSAITSGGGLGLSAGTLNNSIDLAAQGAVTWKISGGTVNNNSVIEALAGANLGVSAGTLNNYNLIQARNGSILNVSVTTLNNPDIIQALTGSTLNLLVGNWSKIGTLIADGKSPTTNAPSMLNLEGSGVITLGAGDAITGSNGGQTVLSTTLNLGGSAGNFLSPSSSGLAIQGQFMVNGGQISGGIVNTADPLLALTSATLNGVTLAANATGAPLTGLQMQGDNITLLNGLTSNNSFLMGAGSTLTYGQTPGNVWNYGTAYGMTGATQALFDFGSGGTIGIDGGFTLNLAAGTTVQGMNATLGAYLGGDTLINGTTLTANNTTWNLRPTYLTNDGLIQAINGGTMIAAPGNWNAAGQLRVDGTGSALYLGYAPYWPYIGGAPALANGDLITATNSGQIILQSNMSLGGPGNQGRFIGLDGAGAGNQVTTDGPSSTFTLFGGRIDGGRINSTSASLVFSHDLPIYLSSNYNYQDNTLDGVTLTDGTGLTTAGHLAGLNLNNGGWAHIVNQLTSNNTFQLDNDAHLVFESDRTFGAGGAAASFTFGATGANTIYLSGGSTLILNPGVGLVGTNANIGAASPYQPGTTTLINTTTVQSVVNGGVWSLVPTILENDGTFYAANGGTLNLGVGGGNFLNNSVLQASGGTVAINAGTVVNNGMMTFNNSSLTFNNSIAVNASGSVITVTGGSLTLNNSNFTNKAGLNGLGALNVSNAAGTLINSTLNNDGNTLQLSSLYMDGSTINDNAVHVTGVATFSASHANYLNNVVFTADQGLDLSNGMAGFGYVGINNGVLTASPVLMKNGGTIDFSGTPVVNANLIDFGTDPNASPGNIYMEGGTTLHLLANTVVQGKIGNIGASAVSATGGRDLTNDGQILANVNNNITTLTPGTLVNNGSIIATNGAHVVFDSAVSNINNGAIEVDQDNSNPAHPITSVVRLQTSLVQQAGQTIVDGALNVDSGAQLLLQGGLLKGDGTVTGNVNNTSGVVAPGHSPGVLTIVGDYTQGTGGATEIDLGGAQAGTGYSQLKVSSLAQLAGAVDVKLVNGFTPTLGETFDFLTYGSRTGQYDQIFSFDNGYDYTVNYNDMTGVAKLVVSAAAAVPETSTLLTAALMFGAIGLVAYRRKRAGQQDTQPEQAA